MPFRVGEVKLRFFLLLPPGFSIADLIRIWIVYSVRPGWSQSRGSVCIFEKCVLLAFSEQEC